MNAISDCMFDQPYSDMRRRTQEITSHRMFNVRLKSPQLLQILEPNLQSEDIG